MCPLFVRMQSSCVILRDFSLHISLVCAKNSVFFFLDACLCPYVSKPIKVFNLPYQIELGDMGCYVPSVNYKEVIR